MTMPDIVNVTDAAALANACSWLPGGITAPASSGETYDSPGASVRPMGEIMVVEAPSAPPGVIPAVMVTALEVVFVNTARPIWTLEFVGGEYSDASAAPRATGATSWAGVIVVMDDPYEGRNATVGAAV
jgi:hypothetical protein